MDMNGPPDYMACRVHKRAILRRCNPNPSWPQAGRSSRHNAVASSHHSGNDAAHNVPSNYITDLRGLVPDGFVRAVGYEPDASENAIGLRRRIGTLQAVVPSGRDPKLGTPADTPDYLPRNGLSGACFSAQSIAVRSHGVHATRAAGSLFGNHYCPQPNAIASRSSHNHRLRRGGGAGTVDCNRQIPALTPVATRIGKLPHWDLSVSGQNLVIPRVSYQIGALLLSRSVRITPLFPFLIFLLLLSLLFLAVEPLLHHKKPHT